MPVSRFARTKLATELANVNRQTFNEAVSAGHYPCAPAVARGAARVFDINEIVSLTVFGRLLRRGYSSERAGPIACDLSMHLKQFPEAQSAVLATKVMSVPEWHVPGTVSITVPLSGLDIETLEEWRLDTIRRSVIAELQLWDATAGEDD